MLTMETTIEHARDNLWRIGDVVSICQSGIHSKSV